MMGNQVPSTPNEGSALAAHKTYLPFNNNRPWTGGRPWCDTAEDLGHTKDTCWKLHGKPIDWKSRAPAESRGFMSTGEEKSAPETTLFSKEQN